MGSSSTLTFTLSNPNNTPLTGVAFSDSLPAGLVIETPNGLNETCSFDASLINAGAGTSVISLSGATLAANESCTLAVDVQGVIAGALQQLDGQYPFGRDRRQYSADGYGEDAIRAVEIANQLFST